jgi:hypothetical protein
MFLVGEVREFTNPCIERIENELNQDGHWIDNEPFLDNEWEMKVILTRYVKPFPEGSLVLGTDDELIQKFGDVWRYQYLCSQYDTWDTCDISDEEIRENKGNTYRVIYEPDN